MPLRVSASFLVGLLLLAVPVITAARRDTAAPADAGWDPAAAAR